MDRVVLFVIGDELLSGKRTDRHFTAVIERLARRGMTLARAEVLPDDVPTMQAAIAAVRDAGDVLLSCGGIGATPDDVTRDAAAQVMQYARFARGPTPAPPVSQLGQGSRRRATAVSRASRG